MAQKTSSHRSKQNQPNKCYNSTSCIISVLVIIFVLGSIVWDMLFTRPEIKNSLKEIRIEIANLSNKIDYQNMQIVTDSLRNYDRF